MTDKPIPAKIILTLADKKDDGLDFIGLSGTLYNQNLIYSEPRELRQQNGVLELIVIFRDYNSFNNWIKNSAIIKFWSGKFDSLLIDKPETIKEKNVIIEVDNIFNCTCEKSNFYVLQCRSIPFTDELICGNCLGQISYSRIPLNIKIEDWQRHYQRVYLNWLDSGLFEKEGYKELTNYKKGKLNIEGENIRKQLSGYFKIPVYINYFVEQPGANDVCLICGRRGNPSGLKIPGRICKKCNTIFGHGNE